MMVRRLLKSAVACIIALNLVVSGVVFDSAPLINSVYADEVEEKSNTLSVSGEATIKAKPDVAYVNVGVQTENAVSKTAQQENGKKMSQVYKAVENLKISKDLIKTENYSVYPIEVYSEKDKKSYVAGYRVINTIRVTVNDIEMVGDVIDAVSQNGANQINNVMFGLKDADGYYLEALKAASKKAKIKAETIAEIFGIKLTIPSQINESVAYQPVYYRDYQPVSIMKDEGPAVTPIAYGDLEIKASVNIMYKY